MINNVTVIICCAGMGTRLGIGTTKALVNVFGKPLILRQLELMDEIEDIRVVVGYQAEKVIECINSVRKDVMYAFNYAFQTTGEAESLSKALIGLKEYTIIIDGDLLINSNDFKSLLEYPGECIGICEINSEEPIFATTEQDVVTELNEIEGNYEYSCIAKVVSSRLKKSKGSVYAVLNKLLPMKYLRIRTRDIDTPDDYERMIEWFEKGCKE